MNYTLMSEGKSCSAICGCWFLRLEYPRARHKHRMNRPQSQHKMSSSSPKVQAHAIYNTRSHLNTEAQKWKGDHSPYVVCASRSTCICGVSRSTRSASNCWWSSALNTRQHGKCLKTRGQAACMNGSSDPPASSGIRRAQDCPKQHRQMRCAWRYVWRAEVHAGVC